MLSFTLIGLSKLSSGVAGVGMTCSHYCTTTSIISSPRSCFRARVRGLSDVTLFEQQTLSFMTEHMMHLGFSTNRI